MILSICTRCRDGQENILVKRGGRRFAEALMRRITAGKSLVVRGVHCMSQCKRPCVVSFMSANSFTYSFGDLDPEDAEHIDAVIEFTGLYGESNEGFVLRDQRPKPLQAGILGRYPPLETNSDLVSNLSQFVGPN
ncbi:MAG: hypothetical protein CML56_03710 [Rhodobacteraceae bacterium]|nr:hypothetical protein [Paracoccaceae bacterium]